MIGYGAGAFTDVNPIDIDGFSLFSSVALVIGLYGSVVGIQLRAIRNRWGVAVIVVTIAVPIQILATGALMYTIHPYAISFLIGVAMTQIDPLSVDTLLADKSEMTDEAKGLLRIWASFDDPVTVLFGFLVLLPLVTDIQSDVSNSTFFVGLLINLIPAGIVLLISQYTDVFKSREVTLLVLAGILVLAVVAQGYLLAAIAGLLLRPIDEKYLSRAIEVLYYIIVFTVGMAIFTYGVDLRLALIIALVEFFVIQPLTTIIVFKGTSNDLIRIAFAQQNGLTTLLMGIAFESLGVHILHILLPAIIIVNLLNLFVNTVYTYKEQRGLIHP